MPTANGPFASAVSRHPVSAHAAGEVVGAVLERLGAHPDLALVFVTPGHAGALEDVGAVVRALLSPSVLLGVVSGAVIGPADDVEGGPGIALWCGLVGPVVPLVLGSGPVRANFRPSAAVVLADAASPPVTGWSPLFEGTGAAHGSAAATQLAVAGGVTGRTGLLVQDRVVTGTPVGALIGPAVRATVLVSEGGRPLGDPMIVTRAERSMVYELDGRPALERLMELVTDRMPAQDVRLVNDGLRLAVLDRTDRRLTSPSLVVRGADRSNGALGLEGAVAAGSVVRFQVRDPRAASEAFERALADAEPSGGAGALLFRSEARPPAWFGGLPSDAVSVADSYPGAALAGCATQRQVGPVRPTAALATDRAALLLFDEVNASSPAGSQAAPG